MLTTAVRLTVGAVSRLVPLHAHRALALVERAAAAIQGKGIGSRSLVAEVDAAFRLASGPAMTVFDVGANRGGWSRTAISRYGDRINRLIVFEPAEIHRKTLDSIPRAELAPFAISDTDGEATLYSIENGSGAASLAHRRLEHFGVSATRTEAVRTVTLDAFAESRGITHIDVLKLDIEGYELAALRGARRLLEQGAIGVLAFEFGGCNIDTRTYFQDFWYLLTGHGYRIGRILLDGRVAPVTRYSESLEMFTTTNYIAWRAPLVPETER